MNEQEYDYGEIMQFLQDKGYSIDAPIRNDKYPAWRVNKYEQGDFYDSHKKISGVLFSGLRHFILYNSGEALQALYAPENAHKSIAAIRATISNTGDIQQAMDWIKALETNQPD
jgi:hypothetical protein